MGREFWEIRQISITFLALKSHSTVGDRQTAAVQSCRTTVERTNSPRLGGFRRSRGDAELYF